MICQNCGGEISENSKFCPLCGHKNEPVQTENIVKLKQKEVKKEITPKKKRKAPIAIIIILAIAVLAVALFPIFKDTILPQWKEVEYEKVSVYIENEDYVSAEKILSIMTTLEKITGEDQSIDYYYAKITLQKGKYEDAIKEFESLGSFEDSAELCCEARYQYANTLIEEGKYEEAVSQLKTLDDYKDSAEILINTENKIKYDEAVEKVSEGEYQSAIRMFKNLGEYSDSKEKISECYYLLAEEQFENKEWDKAISSFKSAGNYKDSKDKINEVENARIQYWKDGVFLKFDITDNFTTGGEFKVHSITAKLSDSEKKYNFVVDVTLPANMRMSFFNPPDGTLFMLVNENAKTGRNTYTFEVSKEKIKSVNSVTVKFTISHSADKKDYGFASFNTNQLY